MKTLVKILVIFTLATLTIGCDNDRDSRQRINTRGNSHRAPINGQTVTTTEGYQEFAGVIQTNQNAVDNFISNIGNPLELIGNLNGMYFRAQVLVQGNQIVGGDIEFAIKDDIANQTGQAYIVGPVSAYAGEVSGQSVSVVFKDSAGEILVTGNLGSGYIQGNIDFINYTVFDSSQFSPAQGTLGNFTVPECSFFVCGY